jgi:hypothetical protein
MRGSRLEAHFETGLGPHVLFCPEVTQVLERSPLTKHGKGRRAVLVYADRGRVTPSP